MYMQVRHFYCVGACVCTCELVRSNMNVTKECGSAGVSK